MKNLMLLTLDYPPDEGGVARYLAGLWGALPPDMAGEVLRLKVGTRRLEWLGLWFRIWRSVRERRPGGLVISHLLPMGYFALKLKLLCRLPYVVIVHGTDLKRARLSAWKRFWATRILRSAALVVANSAFTRDLASGFGVEADRLTVVYPGVNATLSDPENVPRQPHRLLSVCRLVKRKGVLRVLRILPSLLTKFPDLKYVIAGDGPESSNLKSLATELGVATAVEFAGPVSDAERERLYASASVFVLPGTDEPDDIEGFGIVFIEAGLRGLAVVAGNVGGTAEAVLDGRTGLLIKPGDSAGLTSALERLLAHSEEARLMGLAGRARALADFTWGTSAKKLAERLAKL
jgi:glycosyltransferase involved in cell wall biosynthesis